MACYLVAQRPGVKGSPFLDSGSSALHFLLRNGVWNQVAYLQRAFLKSFNGDSE